MLKQLNSYDKTIFIAGMGRSGSTWVSELINFDKSYRLIFEPFHNRKVKEASCFKNLQYLAPGNRDPVLIQAASNILSGKVRNEWTDWFTSNPFSRKKIVKDIRCNLMLKWLKKNFPGIPIVLDVRHALSVTASWLNLGWGAKEIKADRNLSNLISQQDLLNDYPVISEAVKYIDKNDIFERTLFEWCVFHLVPLSQCNRGEFFLTTYESLILQPQSELEKMFEYLNVPYDGQKLLSAIQKASPTNILQRDLSGDKNELLIGWKKVFSIEQIPRANEILSMFDLQHFYSDNAQKFPKYPNKKG